MRRGRTAAPYRVKIGVVAPSERLQLSGVTHSSSNDGNSIFETVAGLPFAFPSQISLQRSVQSRDWNRHWVGGPA